MFWGKKKSIGIAMTCADWRLHQHAVNLNLRLARALDVTGVDLIAVPGPDGLLRPERENEWKAAVAQIALLAGAHHAAHIAVMAHQRCAGHPVSDAEHDSDVAATAKALKENLGFAGPVSAFVAVYHNDSRWSFKRVAQM